MDPLPRKAEDFQTHPAQAHGLDQAHPFRQQATRDMAKFSHLHQLCP